MATQPSLRIGDREREATAAELREHFAHGRLTLEEFNQRLDAVFGAKTQRDLSRITADLPHVRTGGAPLPSARTRPGQQFTSGSAAGWPGGGTPATGPAQPGQAQPGQAQPELAQPWAATPAPTWAGSAAPGSGWPGGSWSRDGWQGQSWTGHRGRRGGVGAFVTLVAAIASWLLVYDVILVGWHIPWVGRAGLLVAIYSVIRGLLRWIFGGGRGRQMRHRTRRRW
jgi:Domain of unknown function (DUF1707)